MEWLNNHHPEIRGSVVWKSRAFYVNLSDLVDDPYLSLTSMSHQPWILQWLSRNMYVGLRHNAPPQYHNYRTAVYKLPNYVCTMIKCPVGQNFHLTAINHGVSRHYFLLLIIQISINILMGQFIWLWLSKTRWFSPLSKNFDAFKIMVLKNHDLALYVFHKCSRQKLEI